MSQLQTGQFEWGAFGQNFGSDYSQTGNHVARRATSDPDAFRSEPADASDSEQNIADGERVLSVAAGLGLGLAGVARRGISGLALTAMGAGLIWRGLTGRCQCYAALGINTAKHNPATAVPAGQGCKLEKTIIVARSPAELYRFWRRFENLPQVMRHLKNVETIDNQRSRWVAEGPLGKDVEWDAEIINERENEMIAWRSLPGGDIDTAGSVHFRPMELSRGTEVTVSMKYNPPAGKFGAQVAALMGTGLEDKLDDDLQTFKQVMETGMPAAPATI